MYLPAQQTINNNNNEELWGDGLAQWLEHWTGDPTFKSHFPGESQLQPSPATQVRDTKSTVWEMHNAKSRGGTSLSFLSSYSSTHHARTAEDFCLTKH